MTKQTKFMLLYLGLFTVLTAVLCGCGSGSAKTTTPTPDPNSPQALIIGKWELSGSTIEFSKGVDATVTQDGDTTNYKYTLTAIDGSPNSVKITLTDSSNSSTSETAEFKDKDTMVLGSSTFKRVTASTSATSNSSGTTNGTTYSSSSSKSTTASSSNASQSSSSSQATKNFNEPGYYATFKYPASMKVTTANNNTIRLDSATGNTYFIRCEQKFLQDSLSKGLTNEEATKSFLTTMTNNLKNDSRNTITNLKVNSLAMNDGSAVSEAMLYCKVGGNNWKVRIQVTAMGGYILMTQIWSDDKGYNNAVKELQGIMDTLAIK